MNRYALCQRSEIGSGLVDPDEGIDKMNLNNLHWGFGAAIGLTVGDYTVAQLSPWRVALLPRLAEYRQGLAKPHRLESYVPSGVAEQLNLNYEAGDANAELDVFYPATMEKTDRLLPTVVWVHGGSWISGSKDYIANYLKIVAAKGFTTVGVNYILAPKNTYPAPVRQVNEALAYIANPVTWGHFETVLGGQFGWRKDFGAIGKHTKRTILRRAP